MIKEIFILVQLSVAPSVEPISEDVAIFLNKAKCEATAEIINVSIHNANRMGTSYYCKTKKAPLDE